MPRLPQQTAESRGNVLSLPSVGADTFGARAGREMQQAGHEISAVAEKIQVQQDNLDLARITADYEVGLDAIKTKVAAHPDLTQHEALFEIQTKDLQDSIIDQNDLRPHVVNAFKSHSFGKNSAAFIDLSHHAATVKAQRVLSDFTDTQDRLTQQAAMDPRKTAENMRLLGDIRGRLVDSGMLSEIDAQKGREASQDRYWNIYAQSRPQELLDLLNRPLDGEGVPAGMDAQKKANYINAAVNTLHQQQAGALQAEKESEKAIKFAQDESARTLRADMLEGKQIMGRLPDLLRSRQLDDAQVGPLLELQSKLAQVPDMSTYQRGLAVQIEASLSAAKHDNIPLAPHVEQNLVSSFVQGHILKDEFQHNMGILRDVQTHKQSQGNERKNQDISHAHTNLVQRLRTTGPADKFDALSEQTIAEAGQFYYRRMNQDPNADPWKTMQEAETIFRPAIEKRLGLSKTDKAVLDDAKMQGLVHTRAISPAAHSAYRGKAQEQAGWNIVQEALKNLPPPPPPGFIERLRGILPNAKSGSKPRKEPGVMGQ